MKTFFRIVVSISLCPMAAEADSYIHIQVRLVLVLL